MYLDTEQTYGDFTLDVFPSANEKEWICAWWARSDPLLHGITRSVKRKEAVRLAKEQIDLLNKDN